MSDAKDAQRERAKQIRDQVKKLQEGQPEPQPDEKHEKDATPKTNQAPPPSRQESPRDFVHRKMEELNEDESAQ